MNSLLQYIFEGFKIGKTKAKAYAEDINIELDVSKRKKATNPQITDEELDDIIELAKTLPIPPEKIVSGRVGNVKMIFYKGRSKRSYGAYYYKEVEDAITLGRPASVDGSIKILWPTSLDGGVCYAFPTSNKCKKPDGSPMLASVEEAFEKIMKTWPKKGPGGFSKTIITDRS